MKRAAGILVLLVAVVVGLVRLRGAKPEGAGAVPDSPVARPETAPSAPPAAPESSSGAGSSVTQATAPSTLGMPSLAQVRAQAAEDPHRTPPVLMEFAARVGERMEQARRDPDSAEKLYDELEGCAQRPGPKTARVFCLTDAHELARLFPARLGSRLRSLRASLPAEILGMEE